MLEALTLPNRRRHLTRCALVAIQAIDRTERTRCPRSDRDDMKNLLDELIGSDVERELFVQDARRIVEGIRPSQWPVKLRGPLWRSAESLRW